MYWLHLALNLWIEVPSVQTELDLWHAGIDSQICCCITECNLELHIHAQLLNCVWTGNLGHACPVDAPSCPAPRLLDIVLSLERDCLWILNPVRDTLNYYLTFKIEIQAFKMTVGVVVDSRFVPTSQQIATKLTLLLTSKLEENFNIFISISISHQWGSYIHPSEIESSHKTLSLPSIKTLPCYIVDQLLQSMWGAFLTVTWLVSMIGVIKFFNLCEMLFG